MGAEAASRAPAAELAPNLAPPPGNPRFPLFDSLRAIAALSVFAGHVVQATYPLATHRTAFLWAGVAANGGVAIFFLISGFLLYRPFLAARRASKPYPLRSYGRRRVLRIVPAYWVALSVFLALGLVHGVTASNWWTFYGFGQIYSFSTLGGGIGVAWTLCVEVTFYAALPLFSVLGARLSRGSRSVRGDVVLLIVLAAASLVMRYHYSSNFADVWVLSTLPTSFFWFALGMALALASVTDSVADWLLRSLGRFSTASWAISLGLFALSYLPSRTGEPGAALAAFVLRGLAAFFLLAPAVFGDELAGGARSVLRWRALTWVGLVSYAFYLYHPMVIERVSHWLAELHIHRSPILLLVLALGLSAACAAVSYYAVERPLMRLGARRGRSGPGAIARSTARSRRRSAVRVGTSEPTE